MLLPTETVQNIASFLPGHDLIALRSTCKLLETQLRGIFLWKFFGVRHVWLNEQSLLNLVEFSKVTHLAQETTTILIRADPTGAINQNISENPTLISYVQMIEIYGRVNASEMRQWKLVDSGHFTDLLSQALRGFSNLSSLKFEGGEEDASYGLRDKSEGVPAARIAFPPGDFESQYDEDLAGQGLCSELKCRY
ncbi:hypothetical protein F4780DRAFT_782204 [Xylariomycetidae sp. FL0641]|nr:hypothetical protein F4780DRAFT_782204 [Xylariomycetidae sp. FL0641]